MSVNKKTELIDRDKGQYLCNTLEKHSIPRQAPYLAIIMPHSASIFTSLFCSASLVDELFAGENCCVSV